MIIPAILESDKEDAIAQINALSEYVPWVQIDFMDGTMTVEKTCLLEDLVDNVGDVALEAHLMVEDPQKYFDACAALGVQRVYFHMGAVADSDAVLASMDPYDFSRGLCLSPEDSVDDAFSYLEDIDAVQIMTVIPGQQGGQFLPEMLTKVAEVRERRTDLWISVDGGVNGGTIDLVSEASVDGIGVGSAIATAEDPIAAYEQLTQSLRL